MTLKLYNTLTRKTEAFKSINPRYVGIYTCGPNIVFRQEFFGQAVYDYAHIGNFRAYIAADILRRYLEYKGFKVKVFSELEDSELTNYIEFNIKWVRLNFEDF